MTSEIGATSVHRPSRADVVRLVGLVLPGVTGSNGRIDSAWDVHDEHGDVAVVVELGPGEHHLGDVWLAGVEAMRTDGARLLSVVTAGAIALLGDGVVHDEYDFIGGGTVDPGAVLRRIIRNTDPDPARRLAAARAPV